MKRAWWVVAVALAASACDEAHEAAPEELTIVVQGDLRELQNKEIQLHESEETLQREKSQLDSRIAELARGLKAAADAEQRRRLEQELHRQQDLEGQINVRATALQAQKSEVEAKRQAIDSDVQKASQAALNARQAAVATREAKLAEREGQLAQMLKDISVREKDVALREKAVSAFERQGPPPEYRDPKTVPKPAAVEKKHKELLAELDSRGVLISDLPPEYQPLNADVFVARRQGDLPRAWDLLGQLGKIVAKLKVDQRFVEQKMVRLQGARTGAKLSETQRGEVERLLREVTASFSDGRYEQANKGLNRIAVILDANAASG